MERDMKTESICDRRWMKDSGIGYRHVLVANAVWKPGRAHPQRAQPTRETGKSVYFPKTLLNL